MNKNRALKVKKIDNIQVPLKSNIRLKVTGNIVELMYSEKEPTGIIYIKKLKDNQYVDLRTGEIFDYEIIENRSENLDSVRRSLGRLRDYINTNCNCIDSEKIKWVTLTYAENMIDTKKLYNDFDKFKKRIQYKYGKFEYIVSCEPQGRGAWHMHMLMIFPKKAPYIDNKEMYSLWSHGFTTTKKLDDNISNIGAYLTAYLGDFDFTDLDKLTDIERVKMVGKSVKNVEVLEPDGTKTPKQIIKGGRLHMYPANFNLYRISRGIKKPLKFKDTEENTQKTLKASSAKLTYEKTISIQDTNSSFENVLNYRYYNI